MDDLDGKYVKIPAERFLKLLEFEDLARVLIDLGVENWELAHQEAYYRKSHKELRSVVKSFIIEDDH